MTVDSKDRNDLALKLRHLIAGQISVDEFAGRYVNGWNSSKDRAVVEIATAAFDSYFDCFAGRLKGRHAVSRSERKSWARTILFLQTGLEYEWPSTKSDDDSFGRLLAFCLLPIGIALLIVALLSMVSGGLDGISLQLGALGFLATIAGALSLFFIFRIDKGDFARFKKHGDYDVWPFLRESDLDEARVYPKLLTRNSETQL